MAENLFTSTRQPTRRKLQTPATTGTRSERLFRERMIRNFSVLDDDDRFLDYVQARVPAAWMTLERDLDVTEPKVKVTLRLDESVAKFYRATGIGYQERINRILASFAQLRISNSQELGEQIAEARAELRLKRQARVAEARAQNGGRITRRMLSAMGMAFGHLPEDAPDDVQHLLSEAERDEFWSRMAG